MRRIVSHIPLGQTPIRKLAVNLPDGTWLLAASLKKMTQSNPWLVQLSPTQASTALFEVDACVRIGSHPESDILLADDDVAEQHASVMRRSSNYVLLDNACSGGTYANCSRIIEHQLVDGDTIRIGTTLFKFLDASSPEIDYHRELQNRAMRDGLTNAYNKTYMIDFLRRELERCLLHDRPLTVLMMDLDYFKDINDVHGHLAGDQVLQELSRRIAPLLDADDIFARYGGEEFGVVMCENPLEDAEELAGRIQQVCGHSPIDTVNGPINVTLSIGIAGVTGVESDAPTALELIHAADEMLYESKNNGRNQFTIRREAVGCAP